MSSVPMVDITYGNSIYTTIRQATDKIMDELELSEKHYYTTMTLFIFACSNMLCAPIPIIEVVIACLIDDIENVDPDCYIEKYLSYIKKVFSTFAYAYENPIEGYDASTPDELSAHSLLVHYLFTIDKPHVSDKPINLNPDYYSVTSILYHALVDMENDLDKAAKKSEEILSQKETFEYDDDDFVPLIKKEPSKEEPSISLSNNQVPPNQKNNDINVGRETSPVIQELDTQTLDKLYGLIVFSSKNVKSAFNITTKNATAPLGLFLYFCTTMIGLPKEVYNVMCDNMYEDLITSDYEPLISENHIKSVSMIAKHLKTIYDYPLDFYKEGTFLSVPLHAMQSLFFAYADVPPTAENYKLLTKVLEATFDRMNDLLLVNTRLYINQAKCKSPLLDKGIIRLMLEHQRDTNLVSKNDTPPATQKNESPQNQNNANPTLGMGWYNFFIFWFAYVLLSLPISLFSKLITSAKDIDIPILYLFVGTGSTYFLTLLLTSIVLWVLVFQLERALIKHHSSCISACKNYIWGLATTGILLSSQGPNPIFVLIIYTSGVLIFYLPMYYYLKRRKSMFIDVDRLN